MKNQVLPRFLILRSALSTVVVLGTSLIISQPATAGSLQSPFIGGSAPGNFNLRCSVPGGSVINCPGGTLLSDVLVGSLGNPGGHVELNSITFGQPNLFTTLQGTLNGNNFLARSLTLSDWVNPDSTPTAFTTKFLNDSLQTNGFDPSFLVDPIFATLTNTFIARGGPQRFSDPNITYVTADDTTNSLAIGLAGVWNASNLLRNLFTGVIEPQLIPDVVQVSEALYVEYGTPSDSFYFSDYLFSTGGVLADTTNGPFFVGSSGQSVQEGFPCFGGAIPGVLDPRAGCSYSGDFQITSVVGSVPEQSILPEPGNVDPVTGAVDFIDVPVLQQPALTWFDPPAVIGFEFVSSNPGTLFASIMLLPRLGSGPGSNEYDIFGGNDTCDAFSTSLGKATGGVEFFFENPVNCFAIGGIDAGLGLGADRYNPSNTNPGVPFPVGLTFDGNPETVSFTQTPVVPEPLTLLGASAAVGIGGFFKRRATKSRKS